MKTVQPNKFKDLLNSFPKSRPPLSASVLRLYRNHYKLNRSGATLASRYSLKLEGWMHRRVAESRDSRAEGLETLEIGAGTLNHLRFEVVSGHYDFIEPLEFLYHDNGDIIYTRDSFKIVDDIPLDRLYDRIISIAVLEHVEDLPGLIERSILHMRGGAVFACGIPSEGGFLWGLAWRLTTALEFRIRTGLNYSELMRHEHVNDAWEIEQVLRFYFKKIKIRRLGLGRHFSLYTYIECRDPIIRS